MTFESFKSDANMYPNIHTYIYIYNANLYMYTILYKHINLPIFAMSICSKDFETWKLILKNAADLFFAITISNPTVS